MGRSGDRGRYDAIVSARTYFVANRLWWFGGLLLGPIVGGLAADPLIGIVATALLILPVFVIFDTDRPWWSDEVRALPADSDRGRREVRLLTTCAAIGLVGGLVVAIARPWA